MSNRRIKSSLKKNNCLDLTLNKIHATNYMLMKHMYQRQAVRERFIRNFYPQFSSEICIRHFNQCNVFCRKQK